MMMESRRTFLKKTAFIGASVSFPTLCACSTLNTAKTSTALKPRKIKKTAVLWYSQTANTEICGIVISRTLEKAGIKVVSGDFRNIDTLAIAESDLLVIGSPVFYYDTPNVVKAYIKSLPDLNGIPVASYVTFGGPEGNQHNAACAILEELMEKNGVPVGLESFMAAKSYPLSFEKYKKELQDRTIPMLPDKNTYAKVRKYADFIKTQAEKGHASVFEKNLTMRGISTVFNPIWWTKLSIDDHYIYEQNCVECGICIEKCPTHSIDLKTYSVNTDSCVLCFGCLNNCEYDAMTMVHANKKLIGFQAFIKQNNLKPILPSELKS